MQAAVSSNDEQARQHRRQHNATMSQTVTVRPCHRLSQYNSNVVLTVIHCNSYSPSSPVAQCGSRANQPVRGSPVSHPRPPPHSLSRSAAQPCAAQPPAITRSQTQAPTRGRGGLARSPVRGRSPARPSSTCSSQQPATNPLRSRKPAQAARAASPGGPGSQPRRPGQGSQPPLSYM